jgi:hypothetical protein
MIEMRINPHRMMLFKYVHKVRGNSLRQHYRRTRTYPDNFDMGNYLDFTKYPVKKVIREKKRISA